MTRSIGAAAVLETAAETPPTVIANQYIYPKLVSAAAMHDSSSIDFDSDNDLNGSAKVDVLKKSMTKGGLSI